MFERGCNVARPFSPPKLPLSAQKPGDPRSRSPLRLPQPHLPPILQIALGEPPARLDELDHVDDLLGEHDGEAGDGEDPGDGAVDLVGARHLHRSGGPWRGEDLRGRRLRRAARLVAARFRLEQRGGEERRAEGEEVEGDEEEFVQGAKGE